MTVTSVLGNFDAASAIFQNIMVTKANSIQTKGVNPDDIRNAINSHIAYIKQYEDQLRKLSVKNDNHYVDEALVGFSRAAQELKGHKFLNDMYLSGNHLYMHFHDIHAYVPELDITLDYGNYMVALDLINGTISIYSTKRFLSTSRNPETHKRQAEECLKMGRYPSIVNRDIIGHPHVRGVGPCMGNLGGMLAKILANHQYDVAVEMVTAYLQATNIHDGWGEVCVGFPIIKGTIKPFEDYKDMNKYFHEKCVAYSKYQTFDLDEDAVIKTILKLPDQRRSLVEAAKEATLVRDTEEVSATVGLGPNATMTNVAISYDEQGNLVQHIVTDTVNAVTEPVPAAPKRTARKRTVASQNTEQVTEQVTENIATPVAPKPKRRSRILKTNRAA